MDSELEMMKDAQAIVEKRGSEAIEIARKHILKTASRDGIISEALRHFAKVTLAGGLPVFPALVSLSREAVDGKTDKTEVLGAALTIIAGTADVHDDIIDKSIIKYSKKTVFGKYGSSIALLAGDALLAEGLIILQKECEELSKNQRKAILSLVSDAILEIGNAEALETRIMKKSDIEAEDLFAIIRMKAIVPEIHCRIGGILGEASEESLDSLGNYGRTFGVASLVRDEFLDMADYAELKNRIENECPPLPMLYALKQPNLKSNIQKLRDTQEFSKKEFQQLSCMVLESYGARKLAESIRASVEFRFSPNVFGANQNLRKEASTLLTVAVSGL